MSEPATPAARRRDLPETSATMEETTPPPEKRAQGPFRDVMKGASVYTAIMIAQRSMSTLLLPLYTRCLSRADYGILDLLDLVYNVVSLLVGMRLGQALFFYYHKAKDDAERGRYVTTGLLSATLLGAIAASAGALMAPSVSRLVFHTPQYDYLVRLSLLNLATAFPADLGLSYLRVRNRSKLFAVAALGRLLGNVTLNVVFLTVLKLGPKSVLLSSIITSGSLALLFIRVILTDYPFAFDLSCLRRMGLYGLPMAVSALGEIALNFGDRAFLRDVVTLSELGLYSLAYKLGMFVQIVVAPFFAYWNSQMVGIIQRKHGEYTYVRTATYLLLGLTIVVLSLTVFAQPLLAVMVAPAFRGAAPYIPWIALAYLCRGMGTYFSNTFLLEKKPGLTARNTWIGAGTCLLAYAVLIPPYRLWGAVAATLLGYGLMASYALVGSQRVRRFRYEFGRWAQIAACAAVAVVPSVVLRPETTVARVNLGLACISLFAILLAATGFATAGERRALAALWRRFTGAPAVEGQTP